MRNKNVGRLLGKTYVLLMRNRNRNRTPDSDRMGLQLLEGQPSQLNQVAYDQGDNAEHWTWIL